MVNFSPTTGAVDIEILQIGFNNPAAFTVQNYNYESPSKGMLFVLGFTSDLFLYPC